MLEESRCRVLVSACELRIDDDELEHSYQYADNRHEEEYLFRATFKV